MNDEAQPGNRSVETAEYLPPGRFAGESDFPADADYSTEPEPEPEDGTGFSAGSVRFSSPTAEFPAVRDFSLRSSGFSAEPEAEADAGADAEADAHADDEAADEPGSGAAAEPGAYAEIEPGVEAEAPGALEASDEPGAPAETEYRARPEFSDVFSRPAFYANPGWSADPLPEPAVPEPAAPEADAAAEMPAAEMPAAAESGSAEPALTVEVPGRPATQHPVRTTGELSVLKTPEPPATMGAPLPDALWTYEAYPVVDGGPAADDQGGLVTLGYLGAAIKRRKKVWILTTVLGVLVAAGLYRTYHATYTDTATVLLALDPNLDSATAIQTDAVLAVDSTMAQEAMQKLGVRETVPSFLKTYSVAISTTSNNLLTFTATAGTSTAAYNEANTLAATFLQYRAQVELEKESANTAVQNQQVTQTQQAISSIAEQIRKVKAETYSTSQQNQLARLQTDQANAQTLLTQLEQTVASDEATSRSQTAGLIAGSRVLDTGIPAAGKTVKKFALEYGGGAVFGGLVLGLAIVVIGAIVSDRLRRRDDVAAALGAPVRLSVASGGKRPGKAGGRQQEADLKRVAAHLRGCVPGDSAGAGSLVVVAVDETRFVGEAIRELAISGAREGKRVVLADLSGGALGDLFGTNEPGIRGVDTGGARVVLVTPERGDLAPIGPLPAPLLGTPMNGVANVHAVAELFITLATVDPATGGAHLTSWGNDVVAVVTAGESSVTRVQAAGEMVRFAGARITSAVLLGADAKDDSLGYATA